MSRIFLTTTPDEIDLPRDRSAVWLHADRAPRPSAERAISMGRFMEDPHGAVRGADVLIVVGLVSQITTPSNRVRTGQFLTDPWPSGPPRISVDDKLFISDPWRLWWHFGCAGADYAGLHTSYRAESMWRNSLVGKEQNPVTLDAVLRYGRGVIRAVNPFRFDFETRIVPMETAVHSAYQAEKERAFSEASTATAVISRLAAFAQRACPERSMPSFRAMFRSSKLRVVATDLGVDRWLVGQIEERVQLINGAAEAFS